MRLITLTLTRHLLYFDGPVLYEAVDRSNNAYVIMYVDDAAGIMIHMAIPLTPQEVEAFHADQVDLLSLVVNHLDEAYICDGGADQIECYPVKHVSASWLPDVGYYYSKLR